MFKQINTNLYLKYKKIRYLILKKQQHSPTVISKKLFYQANFK